LPTTMQWNPRRSAKRLNVLWVCPESFGVCQAALGFRRCVLLLPRAASCQLCPSPAGHSHRAAGVAVRCGGLSPAEASAAGASPRPPPPLVLRVSEVVAGGDLAGQAALSAAAAGAPAGDAAGQGGGADGFFFLDELVCERDGVDVGDDAKHHCRADLTRGCRRWSALHLVDALAAQGGGALAWLEACVNALCCARELCSCLGVGVGGLLSRCSLVLAACACVSCIRVLAVADFLLSPLIVLPLLACDGGPVLLLRGVCWWCACALHTIQRQGVGPSDARHLGDHCRLCTQQPPQTSGKPVSVV